MTLTFKPCFLATSAAFWTFAAWGPAVAPTLSSAVFYRRIRKEGEERQSLLRQPVLKIGNVACFSPITKLVVKFCRDLKSGRFLDVPSLCLFLSRVRDGFWERQIEKSVRHSLAESQTHIRHIRLNSTKHSLWSEALTVCFSVLFIFKVSMKIEWFHSMDKRS